MTRQKNSGFSEAAIDALAAATATRAPLMPRLFSCSARGIPSIVPPTSARALAKLLPLRMAAQPESFLQRKSPVAATTSMSVPSRLLKQVPKGFGLNGTSSRPDWLCSTRFRCTRVAPGSRATSLARWRLKGAVHVGNQEPAGTRRVRSAVVPCIPRRWQAAAEHSVRPDHD